MNLYETLGVSKDASKDEIKRSYRSLSKKFHPDLQHGKSDSEKKEAEEKFKKISEAANILLDDEKRRQYDQYGSVDERANEGFDPFEMFKHHFGGMGGFGGFGDMFGFGGHRRDPNAPIDGDDVHIVVNITFKESVNGCRKTVDIPHEMTCTRCNGTGSADGKRHSCSTCGGTGMETIRNGNVIQQFTCRTCHGRGQSHSTPCKECNGRGVTVTKEQREIAIPAGIETRNAIGIEGLGKAGKNGGNNGNLIVVMNVEQSELFEKRGLDVYTYAYVSPIDFMLGKSVEIIDPYCEKVNVKIPNGFDSSKTLRVRNHGIKGRGVNGDLYIKIFITRPDSLNAECEKIIKDSCEKCNNMKFTKITDMNKMFENYINEK